MGIRVVGSRWQLREHLLPHAPDHAGGQTGPQCLEVSGAADLRFSIHGRGVPRGQAPFRLQREVVDPLDNRRELVEPVLHRCAGQHETVRRIQALHGERGLGRPVLDPLGLVEHDDVRRPLANDLEIANELLVIPQQESAPARLERGAALTGRAIDDGGGSVGEELPLPKPLRLERRGHDDQTTADTAGVPEGVASGNRLRGLAQTHVVGQKQPPPHEEPFNAVVLIAIERLFEGVQGVLQMLPGARRLDLARESRALFLQQCEQCRLAVAVVERGEQSIHERQPLRRRSGNRDRPAVSVSWTQPAPQIAVGCAVHPANARQPVARTGQRADRIPAQRRRLGSQLALDIAATPLRDHVLEDGHEVLAQPERVPEEIGALTTAVERLDPTEQRAIRACARPSAPGRVQTQQPAPWPSDDLNLVGVRGRAAAKHRVERVALDRPVASVRDRQDVAHDALGRHAARPPLCAREQRLIRLALGDGDRLGFHPTGLR